MNDFRVLLVDDNDDFLRGVAAWLAGEDGIQVVGMAGSGRQAIGLVERLRPDLVLTDGTLPEMDGFEATRRIKKNADAPLVVLMTFHDSASARSEASAAGADGFIAKAAITGGLLPLVRRLAAGQVGHGCLQMPQDSAQETSSNKSTKSGPTKDL